MKQVKNHLEPTAQPWVREVEDSVRALEKLYSDISESGRSQGVMLGSVTSAIEELALQQGNIQKAQEILSETQIELAVTQSELAVTQSDLAVTQSELASTVSLLSTQVTRIDNLTTRISEQTTGGAYTSNVNANANAMGTQRTVAGPSWATRAVVVAGATKLTSPSNGWDGSIQFIAKNSGVVYSDLDFHRDTLMIGIDPSSFVPASNPQVVSLAANKTVYLRPIGVYMGSGNRGTNYSISFTYAITWI